MPPLALSYQVAEQEMDGKYVWYLWKWKDIAGGTGTHRVQIFWLSSHKNKKLGAGYKCTYHKISVQF